MTRTLIPFVGGLLLGGCATVPAKRESVAGPLRWEASEPTLARRDVGGKETEAYTVRLRFTETQGKAVTITRIESTLYERNMHPHNQSWDGRWRIPANGWWEWPIGYTLSCGPFPGNCITAAIASPSWRIRLIGSSDQGPLDLNLEVSPPLGGAPRPKMP